jgi:hypothetical protein
MSMARKPVSQDELVDQYVAIYDAMTKDQPDMGCAILTTAFLESALITRLNDYFAQDKKILKNVFGTRGHLGSFAGCRDLAFCLGFLTKQMHTNLDYIGQIRNRFGHRRELLTFDDDTKPDEENASIKELCGKLEYPTRAPFLFDGQLTNGEPTTRIISPRERFTHISALLFRRIDIIAPVPRCAKRIEWESDNVSPARQVPKRNQRPNKRGRP